MENVFPCISVLYIHDKSGGFVGYWFHPNPEALEPKRAELQDLVENHGWVLSERQYEIK